MVKWIPGTDYQLASASYDDTIKIWDMEDDDFVCIQTLSEHASTVWSIVFSRDGKHLVTASEDQTIKVFGRDEAGSFCFLLNISGYHERAIYSVDYQPALDLVASVGLA